MGRRLRTLVELAGLAGAAHVARRAGAAATRAEQELRRAERFRDAERRFDRGVREHFDAPPAEHDGGVEQLILEAAVKLVEAEKGLVLAAADEDHDGQLDLVAVHGFDNDPTDSALADRFGRIVLSRDEMVREDEPAGERPTPADREIDNLVAIPVYLRDRFHGVVVCVNRKGGFADVDDDLLLALGDRAGDALTTDRLRTAAREARAGSIRMLIEVLASRDIALHRQAAETALLASGFADTLGLRGEEKEALVLATLLRDLGNVAIPERLLALPAALSPDERAVVELHPRFGFAILRRAPGLHTVSYAVLYHHERHDGGGYPYGLRGDEIPPVARAVSVLDAYAAMTHDRPYRDARSSDEACEELVAGSGAQFDPDVAALFVEYVRRHGDELDGDLVDALVETLPHGLAAEPVGLEALASPDADALTGLGLRRTCIEVLAERLDRCEDGQCVGVAALQLEELARLNERESAFAGDRLLQATARTAERAASRLGGEAFRISGRRFALVFPCAEDRLEPATAEIALEFAAGPSVLTSVVAGRPGDRPEALLDEAREALR